MIRLGALALVFLLCAAESRAQEPRSGGMADCPAPNYLTFSENSLDRLHAAAVKNRRIKILVVGTASSTLPGRDGARNAYPSRLEVALRKRLPGLEIAVSAYTQPRQTASQLADSLGKLVLDEKPDLVVWQSGTVDALRGVDPEQFRASVAHGVDELQAAGADVILMNMQYSPRTESVIALGGYSEGLRWVAREHEVPLFDRLAIMRHWNDSGVIDLYAATKDIVVAKRVHDCIGRVLAAMIVDGARLESFEGKPAQ